MPKKMDQDATSGVKLLRMFRKLLLNGHRHFQGDLAEELNCSPQTIIRMANEIESVIGVSLETGVDNRRKWYRITSRHNNCLGLDYEELRYMSICRELAGAALPSRVAKRIDGTIFDLSLMMMNPSFAEKVRKGKRNFSLQCKGRIDYAPHGETINALLNAIEGKNVCILTYQASGQEQPKKHRFAPNRMLGMNNVLYVTGATLAPNTGAIRHFVTLAVHRIRDIEVDERHFAIEFPEPTQDVFGLPWHEPRQYKIRFKSGSSAEYVRERIWSEGQKMRDLPDGGLELVLRSQSEPELLAWVRSFGEDAELLKK